jgi:5-methylcytosine-specific restriction enzyme subunit McrC
VARRIPIRNLYYLLCYAWDVLEERDDALVSELEGLSHVELLAKVLSVSVQRLWRRGLDRGYRTIADDVRSPRGRLDVPRTIARQLEPLGLAACSFDELGHDVLHNQILATTARRLSRLPQLHLDLRAAMIEIDRTLADVSTIPVRSSTLSQVQLHGRLRRYRLPLRVCQLIHDQLVVDEATGGVRFLDYVEDDKRMAALFEEFVRNFYRRELHDWSVRSETIDWDLVPLTAGAARYVPEMRTDISLRGSARTVIIDTKFYAEAFASRFEGDKLRAAHLYQLTAYLRNLAAASAGSDASAAGVLLYPEVRPLPALQYQHGPHRLTATGVDLTQDWRTIHQRLLDIVARA